MNPGYRAAVHVDVPTLPGAVLLGCTEPRIFTPPLRELTPDTSLGFAVIEFATDVLAITLFPWQRWLLIHALELTEDGRLRFRKIVVLVARQNGKSTLSIVLALWWLYVCGCRTVLGTAQDLDTAEDVWEGAVDLIEATPELAELADKPVRVNGKKAIRLFTGERYRVKAANRRAGRGLTGDRIILDELREHQSWDAWGAIVKTTTAILQAQIWAFSNAGDMTSVVLRHLRKMAHDLLGDPDGIVAADRDAADQLLPDGDDVDEINDRFGTDLDVEDFDEDGSDLALFEWSAAPGASVWDRDGWAQANPSLGYLISERTLTSDCRTDPEWVYRTESLCQWSEGSLTGPFDAGAWDRCAVDVDGGRMLPADRINLARPVVFGLQVSWDRSKAWITVAGTRTSDDVPQVEIAAQRYGTEWVKGWFSDPDHPERKKRPVAVQPGSPGWSLVQDLIDAGVTVVEWKGTELGAGCARFYDAVQASLTDAGPGVRHGNAPHLNLAAQTAFTKVLSGGSWVWDLAKSPQDAAPLASANAAYWLLTRSAGEPDTPPPPPRKVRGSRDRPAVDREFAGAGL